MSALLSSFPRLGRLFKQAIIPVAALVLAGSPLCQTAQAAAPEKVLKLAVASDITSLDPHVQLSEEMMMYCHWVFDPLLRWTKDMKFENRLAEKWEQIDQNTLRIHLRKGVKFHSGNPMTARDVAWSLKRMKDSVEYKALFEPFGEPKIIDDTTIDLITVRPYGLAVNMLTYLFVLDSKFYSGTDETGQPKDFINKTGPSFANTHESGTGPFYVVAREQGVTMTLKAFPEYWSARGNIGEMEIKQVKNDATRVASLFSGASDMIMPVPTQDYERMSKEKDIQFYTLGSSLIVTIQMNEKRRPELANEKVREAIIRATDNQAIVDKIMKKVAVPATQQLPENMAGYNPELKPRYNPERAKELLKEAGFEKGLEFTMIAPNNRYINDEKIAQAFVGMMAKVGIKVHLKTMPRTQYWDEFDAQVADLQLIGWHPDTEEAGNYTEFLLMCPNKETGYGLYNSGNYCNKRVDELALACQSETDPVKRVAMLQEIEAIAYKESAFIPLHFEPHAWAGKKNLKNFPDVLNTMNFPYLGDLVME